MWNVICIYTFLILIQLSPVMVFAYLQLDISIPSFGAAFRHFDWIIAAEDIELVQAESNLNALYQMEFVRASDFSNNLREKKFSKRTAMYLIPKNLTQLEEFVFQVARIYDIKTNSKFDSRLYTFIRWPEVDIQNRTNNTDKEEIKMLQIFSGKFYLNSEVYILFKSEKADKLKTKSENHKFYLSTVFNISNNVSAKSKTVIKRSISNSKFKFHSFQALEIFSISNKTILQFVDPCWNREYFECYALATLGLRRNNLNGAMIKATAVDHPWDQLSVQYSKNNGTLEFSGGLAVQILWDLRDSLNFSVQAVTADNYISENPNGTVGGMGAQISNGEVDITVPMSYLLVYRVRNMTPLFPLLFDKVTAFFRQPHASTKRDIYSSPFDAWVWVAAFSTIFVLLISVFIFSWFGHTVHGNCGDSGQGWISEESILWAISVICQRSITSWYFNTPSTSTKLIILTALFTSLITSAAYSGAFIAGLAVETSPVNSFLDLISNGFKFLYGPIVYYRYFNTSECPTYGLDVNLKASNHCTTEENGVLRAFQGGFAFVTTEDVFGPGYNWANYSDHQMCSLISKVSFGKIEIPGGFYVQKGSALKEVFNLKLLHIMERGLNFRYWKLAYLRGQNKCLQIKTLYRGGLGLNDVFSAYLFVIVGLPLALALLSTEFFMYKYQLKRFHIYKIAPAK